MRGVEKSGEEERRGALTKPPATVRVYIHFGVFARMAISEVGARFWDKYGEKGGV